MPVNAFKWKHFVGEIILQTVRWYLKYPLSYRNLKEMMAERGIKVALAHPTTSNGIDPLSSSRYIT